MLNNQTYRWERRHSVFGRDQFNSNSVVELLIILALAIVFGLLSGRAWADDDNSPSIQSVTYTEVSDCPYESERIAVNVEGEPGHVAYVVKQDPRCAND